MLRRVMFLRDKVGDFDTELFRWFRAFAQALDTPSEINGKNAHHIAESRFKAPARALRQAVEIDSPRDAILPRDLKIEAQDAGGRHVYLIDRKEIFEKITDDSPEGRRAMWLHRPRPPHSGRWHAMHDHFTVCGLSARCRRRRRLFSPDYIGP